MNNVPFKYCSTEAELENLLDEVSQPVQDRKKGQDIRITFTSSEGEHPNGITPTSLTVEDTTAVRM